MIAPAKTGSDNNNNNVVIPTDHTNNGIWSKDIPLIRILIIVVMKLIAPKIEEIPAKCNEKIARSTDLPPWAILDESGG